MFFFFHLYQLLEPLHEISEELRATLRGQTYMLTYVQGV